MKFPNVAVLALLSVLINDGASTQDKSTARLDGNRDYQVREFVAWGAAYLDLPVTYAAPAWHMSGSRAKQVRFSRALEMPRTDVLKFMMSRLFPHDLVILKVGTGASAYYLIDSKVTPTLLRSSRRPVTEAELEQLKDTYTLVCCVIPVEHVNVQQIQTQVQRLSPQATPYGNAIIPLSAANAILIVDFAPLVYELRTTIRTLDRKSKGAAPLLTDPSIAAMLKKLTARVEALTRAVETKKPSKKRG